MSKWEGEGLRGQKQRQGRRNQAVTSTCNTCIRSAAADHLLAAVFAVLSLGETTVWRTVERPAHVAAAC